MTQHHPSTSLLVAVVVSALCTACASPAPSVSIHAKFPQPVTGSFDETHYGIRVSDPYRGLESLDSKSTRDWVTAENNISDAYLAALPARESFRSRLSQLMGAEWYGIPRRRGKHYFWGYNSGEQEQQTLLTASGLGIKPTILIDPNLISQNGSVAFSGYVPAQDGTQIAYGLSAGGGDWQEWHVRKLGALSDAPDTLPYIKYYAPSFTLDGRGLYYSRFPAPEAGKELSETDHDCKVYFHEIGTPVSKDVVVYERPDHPTWQFEPKVTSDGKYLIITIGDGQVGDRSQEQIVYVDLARASAKPTSLVDTFEAEYIFLGNESSVFYLQTTLDAPTKRIIAVDTRTPLKSAWKEIVPAGKNTIESANLASHELFVSTLANAQSAVSAYGLDGKKIREIKLPGIGSVRGFSGSPDDPELFYNFTSFLSPGSIYRYNVKSGKSALWKAPKLPFNSSAFETKQVFYPSKDGTPIPLFITSKKGTPLGGQNPLLLTGYGGFGHSMTPTFNTLHAAWLERGGVVAVANLRGGGEYGEAWHRAGTKTHKQVVFDDFIAAAEWLITQKYTSREKLGIYGTSNGGLLIGAVLTQRPDLFGAAAALSGVLDMLRFPLFGQGAGWEGDYGSPQVEEEFKALYAYSPVHHPMLMATASGAQAAKSYPPTLVITADHDVRVAPLHSYKFAAALQASQSGSAPVLLRVETKSGHGGGTTRLNQIAQKADLLAFFFENLQGGSSK